MTDAAQAIFFIVTQMSDFHHNQKSNYYIPIIPALSFLLSCLDIVFLMPASLFLLKIFSAHLGIFLIITKKVILTIIKDSYFLCANQRSHFYKKCPLKVCPSPLITACSAPAPKNANKVPPRARSH